jgi:RNA polymerase sigma-B factor
MGRRAVVRRRRSPYTRRWVSAQPATSDVEEAGRTKTPSPSGRLLLRMPPDLHGDLAQAAEREGTSLNGYIIGRLQASLGRTVEGGPATGTATLSTPSLRRLLIANVITVGLASLAAIVLLLVAWLG